jgi:cystathionine beta-lyase
MGLAAAEAAYRKGLPWLKELLAYLKGNVDFIRTFLTEKLPQIRLVEPEGTYLIWLDCTGLGLTREQLSSLMEDRAKLWLDHGDRFGAETALFERLNIAAPRAVLERAMKQLEAAISGKI